MAPNEEARDRDTQPAEGDGLAQTDDVRAPAATDDPDTLRAELDEATRKTEEYLDLLKRARADFANYRRRVEEEQAQRIRDANLGLVMKLLPILDDFERALASARSKQVDSSWVQGVELVERNLRGVLASEEVERIEADGAEFNPWEHEAVGRVPSADVEEGRVLTVVRQGYRRGDRVIRPAQVVVSAGQP